MLRLIDSPSRRRQRGFIRLRTLLLLLALGYGWYHFAGNKTDEANAEKTGKTTQSVQNEVSGAVASAGGAVANATQSIPEKVAGFIRGLIGGGSDASAVPATAAAIAPAALDTKTDWRAMANTLEPIDHDTAWNGQIGQTPAGEEGHMMCSSTDENGATRSTPCKCFQVTQPDRISGQSVVTYHCAAINNAAYAPAATTAD